MTRVMVGFLALVAMGATARAESSWANDPIWHDGLVEKAVYTASRVVYEKPRAYEAIFFTNKEQHDTRTMTKALKSTTTIEVWKFNQVEVVPTPNYDYKYVTTAHLEVTGLWLTRMESSSQEFCGTSFKQYLRASSRVPDNWGFDYFGFSYMPESPRVQEYVSTGSFPSAVAADSLPLWLRNFDFTGKTAMKIALLPSQKSNHPTDYKPAQAEVRYAGEEGDAHRLEVHVAGKLTGTYWMAKDPTRLHIMLKYRGADAQQYDLKSVERVNYWTVK
ncbi:MAG: hypothetical protein QOE14_1215 [Humisphaera sp.]|nr:hypothetical protein [Humisphaera sp.]